VDVLSDDDWSRSSDPIAAWDEDFDDEVTREFAGAAA